MKLSKKEEKFIKDMAHMHFYPNETKADRIMKYLLRLIWILITFWLIWILLGS
jgi:hypothetical protein